MFLSQPVTVTVPFLAAVFELAFTETVVVNTRRDPAFVVATVKDRQLQ